MNRVCTICSVPVGEPHKRKLVYNWKRKTRNLIQEKLTMAAFLQELTQPKN